MKIFFVLSSLLYLIQANDLDALDLPSKIGSYVISKAVKVDQGDFYGLKFYITEPGRQQKCIEEKRIVAPLMVEIVTKFAPELSTHVIQLCMEKFGPEKCGKFSPEYGVTSEPYFLQFSNIPKEMEPLLTAEGVANILRNNVKLRNIILTAGEENFLPLLECMLEDSSVIMISEEEKDELWVI